MQMLLPELDDMVSCNHCMQVMVSELQDRMRTLDETRDGAFMGLYSILYNIGYMLYPVT